MTKAQKSPFDFPKRRFGKMKCRFGKINRRFLQIKRRFFGKNWRFFSERLALSISGLRECAKKNGVFSKKIAVFFSENLRVFLGVSNLAVPERGFTSFRGTFLRSESVPTSIFRQSG